MTDTEKHHNPYEEFNMEVPKENFPQDSISARAAKALIESAMWTDANPMLNLSSFVTTYMEPEVKEIMSNHVALNYVDHDMYPKTYAMEQIMVKWLHGRQAREAAGKDASKPNMVTGGNVQIVWKKFMRYFDVEDHIIPLKPGNYRLTAEHLDEYVNENTICVVAIAGQTFTGEDDDIQEIHDWLDEYEKKTGISIPLHIDGASGGFVNPFLYPDYEWDFRLPRVASINASGHKFGLVYPGIGWVVFREKSIFNEGLIFYVNYLGGESPTATLNFSRNAAQIIAQCYKFLRHGREGYTQIMQMTMDNTERLREKLIESGYFTIMNETQRIPVVALTLHDDIKNFNEFDVSFKVREKGWVLSAYTMPPNAESVNSLRIVVRPHLNRTVVGQLAEDIIAACDYLKEHGGTATPPALHKHSAPKC
jgi:glutamate decarboxylase